MACCVRMLLGRPARVGARGAMRALVVVSIAAARGVTRALVVVVSIAAGRGATRALVVVALAAAVALAAGCSRADESAAGETQSPASAAEWVADARRAHDEADRALARGDADVARRVLSDALRAEVPGGVGELDRRAVRQDLAYRLAQVELEAGAPEAAVRWAEQGLAEGRENDVFTANLLVVRGSAREALGNEREAADDYFEALEINEALLRRTLDGTPAEGP